MRARERDWNILITGLKEKDTYRYTEGVRKLKKLSEALGTNVNIFHIFYTLKLKT